MVGAAVTHRAVLSDLEIPAPPPPLLLDDETVLDDVMPPLPPPVDYDTDAPPNYLEKGKPRPLHSNHADVSPCRRVPLCPVVALYGYEASKPDDLSLAEGDVVYLMHRHDDGWCEGYVNGRRGFFPQSYVQSCD